MVDIFLVNLIETANYSGISKQQVRKSKAKLDFINFPISLGLQELFLQSVSDRISFFKTLGLYLLL